MLQRSTAVIPYSQVLVSEAVRVMTFGRKWVKAVFLKKQHSFSVR